MPATTVDFLKESGQVLFIMTGPPLRCHPWHLSANANIVFALPLRLNHFPRKSHSLRRIYARGSSPFLLGYEKHPNYLGRAFENTCAEVKNKNLVCAKNQEIHADNLKTRIRYVQKSRKYMRIIQKSKLSMCNKLENTCLKAKNNDPACMITGKTHAQ